MNAHVELVRTALERVAAEGSHSLLEHYGEIFTEDFVWKPTLIGSFEAAEYHGRDGFARYLSDFEASFAEWTAMDPSYRAVGSDIVVAHVRMSVRGTESGVPIEQEIGWVLRFEGDKVAEGDAFLSWEEADAAAEGRAHA